MEQASILIVDDDVKLCELIAGCLACAEFRWEAAYDGRQGLARALEGGFDLVLLDVMLPILDGFEVLRQVRRRSNVPVIMLTARGGQEDRVAGLNAGADDYLAKPFGPEELVARIRAVLRRSRFAAANVPDIVQVGNLCISRGSGAVWAGETHIRTTATEFEILDLLARAQGRVVPRDELSAVLYQRPATPYERSIEVHISRLRKKVETTGVRIRAVRGVGYSLSAGDEPV